ncbi:hypothetical protein K431DRAFT_300007 [Polychaeton citri CBS 116435]|uniref:Uncharacterized protein n=1 Tax=Polychaeton citri CBS 116435 TaxID=1314669 RepID=A0A9P4UT38_9PEZI|nr:hypothetical protein K431DRAFT_300007 [Polychaeton citri CBS 116435]
MEDARTLQINNIELQTELRTTRQQLQKAQETITFLAELCTKQNNSSSSREVPRLRKELEERNILIFQLKLDLRNLSDQNSSVYQLGNETYKIRNIKTETGHAGPKSVSDLLCGGDDHDDIKSVQHMHVLQPAAPAFRPTGQPVLLKDRTSAAAEAEACHSDHQPWLSKTYEQVSFSAFDHNHLMGLATYLEDMDEAQQKECFLSLSKRESKHLPIEWRWYWQETVRPAFLAKMAAKDESLKANEVPKVTSKTGADNEAEVQVVDTVLQATTSEGTGMKNSRWTQAYSAGDGEPDPNAQDGRVPPPHETSTPGYGTHVPSPSNYTSGARDIIYRPSDPDPKLYRTVIISNVAPSITLSEVMDKVVQVTPNLNANFIVKATLMNTENLKLKDGTTLRTNTAMIVFAFASDAAALVSACDVKRLTFCPLHYGRNVRTKVELASTPTQPPCFPIDDLKGGKIGRKLCLNDKGKLDPHDVATKIISFARNGVCNPMPYPLKASRDCDGMLLLEYASIEYARAAKRVLDIGYTYFDGIVSGYLA